MSEPSGRFIGTRLCLALLASALVPIGQLEGAAGAEVLVLERECAGGSGTDTEWFGDASDGQIVVIGDAVVPVAPCETGGEARTSVDRLVPRRVCGSNDTGASASTCLAGIDSVDVSRICQDGSRAKDPLERLQLDAAGREIGPWVQIDDGCPLDIPPAVALSVEDLRRLPLSASVASYQPSTGTGLVNMELIVFTDPAPQVLPTTVLGTPVTARATPAQFSWDFGDGSEPLVTTDPGAPYPEFRVFHVYREPGDYLVQLTTTWSGQFQVDGRGPWYPVTGTAQTTSPAYPETIVEAKSHLVDGPLP